jgi:arylsulfatase A-like enzyme
MPRRIFLISVDDLRWDALSCEPDTRYLDRYGLASMRDTPTLDGIAARGARFGQAISTASYTPASHASLLTGCFPPATGVRAFLTNPLPASVPTVAETFETAGFHTVSAIDFGDMFALLGLDRGFAERFVADDAALLAHLEEVRDEPLFCFMHLVDVHPPVRESFSPPWDGYNDDVFDELQAMAAELGIPAGDLGGDRGKAVALSGRIRTWAEDRGVADAVELPRYLAGVNKFDGGRLKWLLERFEALGLLEDSLLVVTSDHGQGAMGPETMGDPSVRSKFDHGETVLEETIRVPLLMAGPRIQAGTAVDRQVSLVDVGPTVLDWAGVDPEPSVQGRSLLAQLDGEEDRDSVAYAEVWYHDRGALSAYLKRSLKGGGLAPDGYETFLNQRVVRTPRMKYSRRGAPLTAADRAGTDAQFVTVLHHKLLARVPDPAVLRELTGQLRDGARTREQVEADVAARALHGEALFDLRDDPWETVNLLVLARSLAVQGQDHQAPAVAAELAAVMDGIEAAAAQSAGPAAPTPGLERVEARLRDLGYID